MLARLLQQLRGARSVDEVASGIGVSRSAIYLWESDGRPNPRTGRPMHRRLPEPHLLDALLEHYGATEAQANQARAMLGQEQRAARTNRDLGLEDAPTELG